ncbi:hypothetical protein Dimus_006556 [Dionaea muscipula]
MTGVKSPYNLCGFTIVELARNLKERLALYLVSRISLLVEADAAPTSAMESQLAIEIEGEARLGCFLRRESDENADSFLIRFAVIHMGFSREGVNISGHSYL